MRGLISDIHAGRKDILPTVRAFAHAQISRSVTVAWAWNDQKSGTVAWTFANADPKGAHAVVLYRNNYIFGGAFWPVYLGNAATFRTWMLDGSQPVPTLVDRGVATNGMPMGILDYGAASAPEYLVAFIFNVAPGQTWSVLEGGFSGGMTPTPGVLYEPTGRVARSVSVRYDPTRVSDWDTQTGTTEKGYASNPTVFDTYVFATEPTTPENTLGFDDTIGVQG